MFTNFFNRLGRTPLLAVVAMGAVWLAGCGGGGKSSSLVGRWVHQRGAFGDDMELFKDGTGMVDGTAITWKAENKRFVLQTKEEGMTCDYHMSGYELILISNNGDSAVFVKKENLEKYGKKYATVANASAPASVNTSGNLSAKCSFAELKTSPLVTFSSDDVFMSSEGNEVKLYINPQTKDSILTAEVFGGMGKSLYTFVFNKDLIEAEELSCGYKYDGEGNPLLGEIASVDKKTLKTSKDAEKKLREAFTGAREELSLAVGNSGGKNAMEYVKLGNELLDRGDKNRSNSDYDLAIAEFDRAIRLDPSIAAAHFGRGRGYLRKGDNSRAIADYSQALRLNPNDAISYSNRGRAYARIGDYDNAIADFESAYRIDPNNNAIKQNLEKARRREKGL
jgi:tetratricopeptide (TPR) repeat protein